MAYEISDSPSEPFDRSRAIRGPRQGFLWGLLVLGDAVGCEWAPIISARLGGIHTRRLPTPFLRIASSRGPPSFPSTIVLHYTPTTVNRQ